jgi:hypothetical protein
MEDPGHGVEHFRELRANGAGIAQRMAGRKSKSESEGISRNMRLLHLQLQIQTESRFVSATKRGLAQLCQLGTPKVSALTFSSSMVQAVLSLAIRELAKIQAIIDFMKSSAIALPIAKWWMGERGQLARAANRIGRVFELRHRRM